MLENVLDCREHTPDGVLGRHLDGAMPWPSGRVAASARGIEHRDGGSPNRRRQMHRPGVARDDERARAEQSGEVADTDLRCDHDGARELAAQPDRLVSLLWAGEEHDREAGTELEAPNQLDQLLGWPLLASARADDDADGATTVGETPAPLACLRGVALRVRQHYPEGSRHGRNPDGREEREQEADHVLDIGAPGHANGEEALVPAATG